MMVLLVSGEITANRRRAALLVSGDAVLAALVLGAVGFVVAGPLGMVVAAVAVVVACATAAWTAPAAVRKRSAGVPAEPVAHARLHNLTEGLCVAVGLPKPALLVVDDPAPNSLACGRSPRDAALVVTTGLLEKLNRVELEGVLAHELSHVKNLDILPTTLAATIAAPLRGAALRLAVDSRREVRADLHGASLTRYPPGLLAALEKIRADPSTVCSHAAIAHLWLEPPSGPRAARPALDGRIQALKEL